MSDKTIQARFYEALCDMENPTKDAVNPHFKSGYATLGAVMQTVKPCLQKHGLMLQQRVDYADVIGAWALFTNVIDANGEKLEVDCRPFTFAGTPQQNGSEETYLRRYALMCCMGLSAEDDDGNAANERPVKTRAQAKKENEFMPALRNTYRTWKARNGLTNEEAMALCVACIGKPITDDLTVDEVNTLLEMMRRNDG